MAAKQGLSAQFSQASEDAKRAVLGRTKSSWLHSMNTTCTIKSAPPRSPEVLQLLSTKSGWLWKRNEQHIWQSRWCCVVPHMFLYYFDIEGNAGGPPKPSDQEQLDLNQAVRLGYANRPQTGPRSSLFPFIPSNDQGTSQPPEGQPTTPSATATSWASATPAGIIDLECYSSVSRSSENALVLELSGNEEEDPDLRSFYFCATGDDEGDEWTKAFLQERHSSLVDEREAYRQVCDGFAEQLQELHTQLDNERKRLEESNEECYRVRSATEETRRQGWSLLRDVLERELPCESEHLCQARLQFRSELERTPHHELVPALQVWQQYTRALQEASVKALSEKTELQQQVEKGAFTSDTRVQELQAQLETQQQEWKETESSLQQQVSTLKQALQKAQTQYEDSQQDVASQKMEMTMYQTSSRTKIQELQSHKKILKKEVIELRKTLEDLGSELSLVKHTSHSNQSEVMSERRKTELLERYVEKMERQVQVQQNMMEMMSLGGGGTSRAGDSFPHNDYVSEGDNHNYHYESEHTSPRHNGREVGHASPRLSGRDIPRAPQAYEEEEEDVCSRHQVLIQRAKEAMIMVETRSPMEDEKSHMSELTEDRTQRNLDYHRYDNESPLRGSKQPPHHRTSRPSSQQPMPVRPPPYILGLHEDNDDDDIPNGGVEEHRNTISGRHSSVSLPPPTKVYHHHRRQSSSSSVGSSGSQQQRRNKKLSVAQRARLEAEERGRSASFRVTAKSPVVSQKSNRGSRSEPRNLHRNSSDTASQSSFLSNLGRSLSDALDNSVLGVPDPETSSEDSGRRSTTDEDSPEEDLHGRRRVPLNAKNLDSNNGRSFSIKSRALSPVMSETNVSSTTGSLSLQERQQLQRAQQIKFLKEQGLLKEEANNHRGGGSSAKTAPESSSVGSFH